CTGDTPAVCTTARIVPRDAACFASAVTSASFDTSVRIGCTSYPSARKPLAPTSSCASEKSASTTTRPWPMRRTTAMPMPPAPVTTSTGREPTSAVDDMACILFAGDSRRRLGGMWSAEAYREARAATVGLQRVASREPGGVDVEADVVPDRVARDDVVLW